VTGQHANAAALILDPNRNDIVGRGEDLRRRSDREMEGFVHDAAAACFSRAGAADADTCEAFSLSRASSSVPTM
jgi:hypothetical protein